MRAWAPLSAAAIAFTLLHTLIDWHVGLFGPSGSTLPAVPAALAWLVHLGRLDVLHNNVGIGGVGSIRQVTEADWDHTLTINLKSMLLTIQAAIPALEAAGGGSIINVSSVAGLHYGGLPLRRARRAKPASSA